MRFQWTTCMSLTNWSSHNWVASNTGKMVQRLTLENIVLRQDIWFCRSDTLTRCNFWIVSAFIATPCKLYNNCTFPPRFHSLEVPQTWTRSAAELLSTLLADSCPVHLWSWISFHAIFFVRAKEFKLEIHRSSILPHLMYVKQCGIFHQGIRHKETRTCAVESLTHCLPQQEQLLVKTNLPSLNNRRLQEALILMYKIKHRIAPSYLCDLFRKSNKRSNLTKFWFSITKFYTVRFGKHSIWYLGPYL